MGPNTARILLLPLLAFLTGCQIFGPATLKHGRVNYNNAIEETQKIEIFSNFVRVLRQEPTLFMEVTEIDASSSVQSQLAPQISGVGIRQQDQLTGPSLSYTEQPVIKYQPLNGQELVAQIAKPITAESLADLLDSEWNLVPVLSLTVDRITPQFIDQGAALNAIAQLNDYKALVLTSFTQSAGLRLYLRPENPSIAPILDRGTAANDTKLAQTTARRDILHLWIRLLRIYEGTQTGPFKKCPITSAGDACLDHLDRGASVMDDAALNAAFAALPSHIDLRNIPAAGGDISDDQAANNRSASSALKAVSRQDGTVELKVDRSGDTPRHAMSANIPDDRGPMLHTRSALGVLKAITRSGGTVFEFKMDEPEDVERFAKKLAWAKEAREKCLLWPNYYAFPPSVKSASQGPDYTDDQKQVAEDIESRICVAQTLKPDAPLDVRDFRALRREYMLYASRAFILYETSTEEPEDAYVSYYDGGRWYYISNDDGISKTNLLLLAQFLTMQAVPSKNETSPVSIPLQ